MNRLRSALILAGLGAAMAFPAIQMANNGKSCGSGKDCGHEKSWRCQKDLNVWGRGELLAGDFHQHTLYTDGSTTFDFVMGKNNEYGLDWWANSEHGGSRYYDGNGVNWDTYPTGTILGDYRTSNGHQVMYRWQSLRDFVFPDILRNRDLYPDKKIFSGLEWNVPGHEHCSTGIVAEDASAISAFEYQFDKSDPDTSRTGEVTPFGTLVKANGSGKPLGVDRHADAVAGCRWMQEQYDAGTIDNAWIVFAHIERAGAFKTGSSDGGYNIEHFRDFNNAAPDICFGFEGAPGHQANSLRGFGNTAFGGSYGGVGFYTAKVGGLWDALLGEGRRWFNFASSDYHTHYTAGGDDFYPGEYQKDYVYAVDQNRDGDYSYSEIADGLRSGNSFFVLGDLINYLDFEIQDANRRAQMGGELESKGKIKDLKIKIKFKSPRVNNNGDVPAVDHIDLIAGEITGPVPSDSPDYTKATNESTKVIATFSGRDFEVDKHGYRTVVFHIKDLQKQYGWKNAYFRLRGTNLAPSTAYETDADGNPIADTEATANLGLDGADEAWADLWFYSNPIFVYGK